MLHYIRRIRIGGFLTACAGAAVRGLRRRFGFCRGFFRSFIFGDLFILFREIGLIKILHLISSLNSVVSIIKPGCEEIMYTVETFFKQNLPAFDGIFPLCTL